MTVKEMTGVSRRGFIASSLALGAAGLALRGHPALAQVSTEGGRLRARLYADISNLDPAFWTSGSDALVMECIFAFAMQFETGTNEFNALPLALKALNVIDDTHIGFELYEGILYSGEYGEMTAEDAKFSWERIADPAVQSPYAADWAQLDHVEVTGRYSGTILLKSPFAPLFTTTLPATSGIILPKAAIEAAGGQFSTEPPVTSGPYRIREWQPRTRLVLEKNPDFTLFDVAFDELVLIPIEDPKTAELGFEAGDLDHAQTSISSIPRFAAVAPNGGRFDEFTALNYYWLGMNEANADLTDQKVRRAIQHGIDRDAVVEAAYLGLPRPPPGSSRRALRGTARKTPIITTPILPAACWPRPGCRISMSRFQSSRPPKIWPPPRLSRRCSPISASPCRLTSMKAAASGASGSRPMAISGRACSSSSSASPCNPIPAGPPPGSLRSRWASGTGSGSAMRNSTG
ncbi:ABC transporter substrate-binding protein [Gemmobacter sp. 24YEA27]|uniref:ABC transporter substrate-binding protein n=1 Tax=Gemmobacter sp. 24YEA27 TaxID=3040672 RepID=UPI0024B3A2F6|nr:ABC transporter substrate-binding protein [Gemmobacter sp. 24YEA27]